MGRPDGVGAVFWPRASSSGQMGFVWFRGALLCQVTHSRLGRLGVGVWGRVFAFLGFA